MLYKVIEEDDYFGTFHVRTRHLHKLREVLLSKIPIVAVDKITILHNTSGMQDDVLKHRISLVPVTQICGNLYLKKKGSCDVVTDHFTSDGPVMMKDVLLLHLAKNQSVELKATCSEGIGHAKHAALCNFYWEALETDVYRVKIESVGQCKPSEIMRVASEILQQDSQQRTEPQNRI